MAALSERGYNIAHAWIYDPRPLATHEPLESLRFRAILSARTLVGAVFLEWPPRRGFP